MYIREHCHLRERAKSKTLRIPSSELIDPVNALMSTKVAECLHRETLTLRHIFKLLS